jgi:hypothetical protein
MDFPTDSSQRPVEGTCHASTPASLIPYVIYSSLASSLLATCYLLHLHRSSCYFSPRPSLAHYYSSKSIM